MQFLITVTIRYLFPAISFQDLSHRKVGYAIRKKNFYNHHPDIICLLLSIGSRSSEILRCKADDPYRKRC